MVNLTKNHFRYIYILIFLAIFVAIMFSSEMLSLTGFVILFVAEIIEYSLFDRDKLERKKFFYTIIFILYFTYLFKEFIA